MFNTRIAMAVLVACCASVYSDASTDDPLACVDAEVRQALVPNRNEGEVRVTRGWNADFPAVSPQGLSLVGTRRSERWVNVVFQSTLTPAEATKRLETAMTREGWRSYPTTRGPTGGFQAPTFIATTTQVADDAVSLCHADYGQIEAVSRHTSESGTYTTLLVSPGTGKYCMVARTQAMSGPDPSAIKALPVLTYPSGATGTPFGAVSTDGTEVGSYAELATAIDASNLLQHFGTQLETQGWRREQQWKGRYIAGSVWLSGSGTDSGVLTIANRGNGAYKLKFALVQHR